MVMVAPVEATYTMVSQFSILQQKYGCFSAVLAVYGQIRAGRCSTRRGGFRKTPRAPLARTRGNEMITRVQRALSTKAEPKAFSARVCNISDCSGLFRCEWVQKTANTELVVPIY